jgi:NADH-quinone oxidoreductase subunit E
MLRANYFLKFITWAAKSRLNPVLDKKISRRGHMNPQENKEKIVEEKFIKKETKKILRHYKSERIKLLTILQQIQESLGYIPKEAMLEVASQLNIPEVDVFGVVTFYNQFRLHPPGKHQIKVCTGTACHMKGGKIILDCWERRLRIKVGETTGDRKFSLERVACVGCCTMAPVTVINEVIYSKVTPTRVDGILRFYQVERHR